MSRGLVGTGACNGKEAGSDPWGFAIGRAGFEVINHQVGIHGGVAIGTASLGNRR